MFAQALLLAALAASQPAARPVLTVLYFDNHTGPEYQTLRKGLADMIIADLVAWDGVTVVEREKLESVMEELRLQSSRSFDPVTAAKIGKLVGAQFLLTGSVAISEGEMRLDARLIKVESGVAVASATARGPKDKVFDLEQELVEKITAGIDLKVKNLAARRRVKVPSLEALLDYSKAIELSDQGKEEEARAALQQVVSKSPTFLLARERKDQILKALEESRKRRSEMVTEAVTELGRRAEAVLAVPMPPFEERDEDSMGQVLRMRLVRAGYLARVMRSHLSRHDDRLKVPLKGEEKAVGALVEAYAQNLQSLSEETELFARRFPGRSPKGDPQLDELARSASFGDLHGLGSPVFAIETWVRFAMLGTVKDGDSTYAVAPAPVEQDSVLGESAMADLDRLADAAEKKAKAADGPARTLAEQEAIGLLDAKADVLEQLRQDDEAAAALQRILDLFPNSARAAAIERRIRRIAGAEHDHQRSLRESWAKALAEGCKDDMDIRKGLSAALDFRLGREGLAGLSALAAELEKACQITPRNRSAFAGVYRDLAMAAAKLDDCESSQRWWARYLAAGGSVGDLRGYHKNYAPWCSLGDVEKTAVWMYSKLDRDWSLELSSDLGSSLSDGGEALTVSGRKSGQDESLSLAFKRSGAGSFMCKRATWRRYDGSTLEGDCFGSLSADSGRDGFDQGNYRATFKREGEPLRRQLELSEGTFRVPRR